jgi:F-type H+-transporting ATPase subunit gamma
MASQREIKRRIRSIQNTAQITKAMQMVAASRMRRAQQRVTASRPYSDSVMEIMADISAKSGAEGHPLLTQREIKTAEIVTVTPNRGLAGSLIANLNRETARLIGSLGHPARIVAVGKKGRDFALHTRYEIVGDYEGLGDNVSISEVGPIATQVMQDYQNGDADVIYLVYSRFISTLRQQPVSVQLLPVIPPTDTQITAPWNYEPDNPEQVLNALVPRYIEFSIYHAILETQASFHSAQMIAMSNATDAANDLVKDLTLAMNKARQADITKEIAEISGAAEAIQTSSA